ncbi:MAG TPA: hypothetical protein PLJ26_06130 [Candidatus Omnitrophota bacterium]|nr:hypothetical protein [Candidatus Omnitrophota bacterium]HQJ16044.1 hypothetical protein [Candidatus Omnitrophota bacterium]
MPILHAKIWRYASVAAAAVFCIPCAARCQHIEVTTNKNTFKAGEKVELTITNISPVSVFCIAASSKPEMGLSNIERKASVGWDALPLRCRQPSCTVDYTVPAPEEIKAGRKAAFSWTPRIYEDNAYVSPGPGTYRVAVLYQVKKETDPSSWNWTTVRSNTFTLE